MREAHTQLQLPEIYSKEGEKKNSIIERDIKILPYLINRGGVGAGRRKSLGFDERERETETRGIREKNGPERRTSLGFGILCGL